MRFKRKNDEIHVYRSDDTLLMKTAIVDDRIYIAGMYHYAFELAGVDLQQDPITGRRKYVELATIGIEIDDEIEEIDESDDDEEDHEEVTNIDKPQVRSEPRSVRDRRKTSRYNDLQAEKFERLGIRLMCDNMKITLINNAVDAMAKESVLKDAIVLLEDKKINWSSIDKLDKFREEHLDHYEDIEIVNEVYKNAVDDSMKINKFSTEGFFCGRELITVAQRFYDLSESITNDRVSTIFSTAARATLDRFRFPPTNKSSLRKVPIESLIHMARVLVDLRHEYSRLKIRMPNALLYRGKDYGVDTMIQNVVDLYKRNGLELAFMRDDKPSNYKDVYINPVVTDRVYDLL